MNRIMDFLADYNQNRAAVRVADYKRRFPELFEVTPDLTAVEGTAQPIQKANTIKTLKLQTNNISR